MTRRPNNLTASLPPGQALRGEINGAASSASDVAQHLRELLDDRGALDPGTITVRFD
jgi:hypothetical protein